MSAPTMDLLRSLPRSSATLAVLSTLAFAGCNALTGADGLVIIGGEYDDGNGEGGTGANTPYIPDPGPAGGAGGDGSGQGAGHPGQGGSTSTTTSDTTTSTTTSDTTSSSSSSGGGVQCEYPTGGFGVNTGNFVKGTLVWQGFPEGAAESSSIAIQDYFDCDGSKGINAILIVSSATWCGVCQEEATDLPSHEQAFATKGIRVLTLMVENASGAPATLTTATSWRNGFGLEAYGTAADPNFTFAGMGSVGLPLQILVDPRTMQIVDRIEGFGDYSALTQLANQNAN